MLRLLCTLGHRVAAARAPLPSHPPGQLIRRMTGTLAATSRENLPTEQPPAKLQRTEAEPKLLVKRLSEHATLPKRGSAGAAGYDLARCA